jgi:hypothetical protein
LIFLFLSPELLSGLEEEVIIAQSEEAVQSERDKTDEG